jgi:hypothetical protein
MKNISRVFLLGLSAGCGGTSAPSPPTSATSPAILYATYLEPPELRGFAINRGSLEVTTLPGVDQAIGRQQRFMAVHPSGRWLYLYDEGLPRLYEISDGGRRVSPVARLPWESDAEELRALSFSADGRVAIGYLRRGSFTDYALFGVSLETGSLTLTQRGFEAEGRGALLSPGGSHLLTHFWSRDGGKPSYEFRSHRIDASTATWSRAAAASMTIPGDGFWRTLAGFAVQENFPYPNAEGNYHLRILSLDEGSGAFGVSPPIFHCCAEWPRLISAAGDRAWIASRTGTGPNVLRPYKIEGASFRPDGTSSAAVGYGYHHLTFDPEGRIIVDSDTDWQCIRGQCFGTPDELFVVGVDPQTGAVRSGGAPLSVGNATFSMAFYPR